MMIHMGDRLGLYSALRDQGALSAPELATSTGLQERWLLESAQPGRGRHC